MKKLDFILNSNHNRKRIAVDVRWEDDEIKKPIILFVHGFKGFKDWGAFNLVADYFAQQGFAYFKLNLSHNGTSPENPCDFVDLEAFGNNNYSIELDDIDVLLNHIFSSENQVPNIDLEKVYLIGHSRGGGVAILKTKEDSRIKKLTTWASVKSLGTSITGEGLKKWKEEGVMYVWNGRTKQNMPMYWQIYKSVQADKNRFDVMNAATILQQEMLIIHGTADPTVPLEAAQDLKKQKPNAELFIIENADHVFGSQHPYQEKTLPNDLQKVIEKTAAFFFSEK